MKTSRNETELVLDLDAAQTNLRAACGVARRPLDYFFLFLWLTTTFTGFRFTFLLLFWLKSLSRTYLSVYSKRLSACWFMSLQLQDQSDVRFHGIFNQSY